MVHCIYRGVTGYNIQIKLYFSCLKITFVLVNSADPDEMLHCAACHLGLGCLPKYPFRSFPVFKGLKNVGVFDLASDIVLSLCINIFKIVVCILCC